MHLNSLVMKDSKHGQSVSKDGDFPRGEELLVESLVHSLAAMKEGVRLETVK